MDKETLIILGTGNATVTKCFNTCFAIETGEEYFLVDTGGGNGIMTQLEKARSPWKPSMRFSSVMSIPIICWG